MVCLEKYKHPNGIALAVQYGSATTTHTVTWSGAVTEGMLKAYAEPTRATEMAACAIALLLIHALTPYTAFEQSVIGTTIDYYLRPQTEDDTLIFNNALRLEISGILAESKDNTIKARIKEKIRRLKQDGEEKTYIVVVEFSQPQAEIAEV